MSNKREDELKAEGWIKRFVAGSPRLEEAVEMYQSLGYEVLQEPISCEANQESAECRTCLMANREQYKTIYTRTHAQPVVKDDDLF
jgi:hypothetical protein